MKKGMNVRTLLILIGLLFVTCFLPYIVMVVMMYARIQDFGTSGLFTKEQVEEHTMEVIELLEDEEYETLLTDYYVETGSVENGIKAMEAAVKDLNDDWGDQVKVEDIILGEMTQRKDHYATSKVIVVYENITVRYEWIFDEDLKIAGYNIIDHIENPMEEEE